MVRWVVGSILHGEDPLSYFSFQPVLHDWCNKGRGMMHIKEPLLLIRKSRQWHDVVAADYCYRYPSGPLPYV